MASQIANFIPLIPGIGQPITTAYTGAKAMLGLSSVSGIGFPGAVGMMSYGAILQHLGLSSQLSPEEIATDPQFLYDQASLQTLGTSLREQLFKSPHSIFKAALKYSFFLGTLPRLANVMAGNAPFTRKTIPLGLRTLFTGWQTPAILRPLTARMPYSFKRLAAGPLNMNRLYGGFLGSFFNLFGTGQIGKAITIGLGYRAGGVLGTFPGFPWMLAGAKSTDNASALLASIVERYLGFPMEGSVGADVFRISRTITEQYARRGKTKRRLRNVGQTTKYEPISWKKDVRLFNHTKTQDQWLTDFTKRRDLARQWIEAEQQAILKFRAKEQPMKPWLVAGETARGIATGKTGSAIKGSKYLAPKERLLNLAAYQFEKTRDIMRILTHSAGRNFLTGTLTGLPGLIRWAINISNPEKVSEVLRQTSVLETVTAATNRSLKREGFRAAAKAAIPIGEQATTETPLRGKKGVAQATTGRVAGGYLQGTYTPNAGRIMAMAGLQHLPGAINAIFAFGLLKRSVTALTSQALSTIKTVSSVAANVGKMEFGSGRTLETVMASTERTRAIAAMQNIGISARSYLGHEASIVAQA